MQQARDNDQWAAQIPLDPLQAAVMGRQRDVMAMVSEALSQGRARLAYQPVVTAKAPRKIAFHEGLVRVMDDGGRVIPAGDFMGRVEETGIGRDIDCLVLDLALKALTDHPQRRLSINVSARSIADASWRRVIEAAVAQPNPVVPRLILEVSEDSAMSLHEVVIRFMAEMQPHGLAFTLDGFGGGLISFRYLKDFMFDMVKIDRAFIRNIERDADNQALARALLAVARQFEMFTIAEGIESAEEAGFMTKLGVDCLQGYHLGVPKFSFQTINS